MRRTKQGADFASSSTQGRSGRITLEILDLSDKDSLFYFIDDLQSWEKTELRRHGSQDLATAIAEVESFIDIGEHDGTSAGDESPRGNDKSARRSPRRERPKDVNGAHKSSGCFLCNRPHKARECPKKAGFHAMMVQFEETEAQQEEAQTGLLRILSAMKAKTKGPEASVKGLQYVQAKVNGLPVRALVDSGATHNFVSVDEAKRLGLKTTKE